MAETNTAVKPVKKSCWKHPIWIVLVLVALSGGIIGPVLSQVLNNGNWVKGTWVSNYNEYITITDTQWIAVSQWGGSANAIDSMTNSHLIYQNSPQASYNPNLWSKVQYHPVDGGWGYCTTVYDGATKQAAIDKDTSAEYDPADAAAGCGASGFAHTTMKPYANPIVGTWTDNYGATITINATTYESVASWGTSPYEILAYGADWILMQNSADDSYNPSKWTLVKHHPVGSGFGFCMVIYNSESPALALATDLTGMYDAANSTHGCGSSGFPHSIATPA